MVIYRRGEEVANEPPGSGFLPRLKCHNFDELHAMKTKFLIFLLLSCKLSAYGQDITRIITEENVSRIIKTLSSDTMMGRPALEPASIEPATRFIENEFTRIGLQPMKGLNGFRQQFEKQRIGPKDVQVLVNDKIISRDDVIIFSDQEKLEITGGLPVISLANDTTVSNSTHHFFQSAYTFMMDSSSAIMMVPPDFHSAFMEFKSYFEKHFTNNRKNSKVFILGASPIDSYFIKVTQKIETIAMSNVVGMIPGKRRPEEIILFSAHYDHIGIQRPIAGDSIANGADDDASGTTAVIELARYFKKRNNSNRTLIFVAFTAEEIGGHGSKYFSEHVSPEQIVAMFNIEMIGKPSKWGRHAAFVTGFEKSDLGPILAKNVSGRNFTFSPDPYPEQDLFYRSDNATLARLGVPAHTISTDQIDIDPFYHTVNDEFETIDITNVTATIRAIALGSGSVVDGTDTPTRIDLEDVR